MKSRQNSRKHFGITIADLLISGFCRQSIKSSNFLYEGLIPMILVTIIVKYFDGNPHLPWLITKSIPLKKIFNGEIMDLRCPKWTNLSYSARILLKIWLKCRQNTVQSPYCSLTTVILSENEKKFDEEGCFWLKSIMPYHPEIEYVDLSNNYIKPKSLQLIIDGIKIRKDNLFIRYPFLQLKELNLGRNKINDKYAKLLLKVLYDYCPHLSKLNLDDNKITNTFIGTQFTDTDIEEIETKYKQYFKKNKPEMSIKHEVDWDKLTQIMIKLLKDTTIKDWKIMNEINEIETAIESTNAIITYKDLIQYNVLSGVLTNLTINDDNEYDLCNFLIGYYDNRTKKNRHIKSISLRQNNITFNGAVTINDMLYDISENFEFRIELASNPINVPLFVKKYKGKSIQLNDEFVWDKRIRLYGK